MCNFMKNKLGVHHGSHILFQITVYGSSDTVNDAVGTTPENT
jgi:hypothetical protein